MLEHAWPLYTQHGGELVSRRLVLQRRSADVGPATCGNSTTIWGANLPDQDCDQQLRSWLSAGAVAVLTVVVTQVIASVTAARELSVWSSMSKPCWPSGTSITSTATR